jgi:hypothetical protein
VDGANLTVHQDPEGNVYVPGLTHVPVESAAAVDALMARAARKRAVAVTQMNAQSSRSHSVFSLYIRGRHEGKGIAVSGSLNLCDLAGSERLSRSGAEGDRRKETQAINKSLSCLADVFGALAKKAPHVPFRNSKLTHLLQKCFRGDGKTLMLVNLSPTMASAQESLCSLRFAAQVSQVELGKPKKRVVEALGGGADEGAAPAAPAPPPAVAAWAARANAGALPRAAAAAGAAASSSSSSSSSSAAAGDEAIVADEEVGGEEVDDDDEDGDDADIAEDDDEAGDLDASLELPAGAVAGAGAGAGSSAAPHALAGAKRALGAISRHGVVASSFMGRPAGAGAGAARAGAPKAGLAAPRLGAGAGAGAGAAASAAAVAAAKKARVAGPGGAAMR